MKKNIHGFTLIELIVVVTILAILATIAFFSYADFSKSARNSSRVADLKTINKALGLREISGELYPLPDNPTTITYSGALAWTQWTFGTGALIQTKRISNPLTDPLLWVEYSYSVSSNRSSYQLAAALEGSLFWYQNPLTSQAHAISNSNYESYTLWDYISYDLGITDGTWCSVLTIPSLILSDIPVWWILIPGTSYNYGYSESPHIPNSYNGVIASTIPASGFQTSQVLDICNISTVLELELYIAQLSTAYQPLSSNSRFARAVYNSNTTKFQLDSVESLIANGITVDQSVIDELNTVVVNYTSVDTFTDTDATQLTSHMPDSPLDGWSISTWSAADYTIQSNTLTKNWWSNSLVYMIPNPTISNNAYGIGFKVVDFGGGTITAFLRYTNSNNYYRVDISSTGYQLIRRISWSDVVLQNISETINVGDTINFAISGDSVELSINNIEKENILAWGLTATWDPMIYLQSDGAAIDNFTLNYR